MPNRNPSEQDALRVVLGPTEDCPSLEELESFASGEEPAATFVTGHVHSCPYCQTELHLLRTFLAEPGGRSNPEVARVAARLRSRSKDIFRNAFPPPARLPWRRSAFTMRRLAQTSLAVAAILLVAGAVAFFRSASRQPQLEARSQTSQEVFRSGGFAVLSPAGDLRTSPQEIRWERVPGATSYRVSLLEVDRTEIWRAETAEDHVELPSAIQARIVPAKTLFTEVIALDSSGKKVADTGLVRFRLLQAAGRH